MFGFGVLFVFLISIVSVSGNTDTEVISDEFIGSSVSLLFTEETADGTEPATEPEATEGEADEPEKDKKVETVKYKYDDKGNLIEVIFDDGYKFEYEYDENGRKTKEVTTNRDGSKETTIYKYDDNGNLIEVIFDDGSKIECEYDENGRETKRVITYSDGSKETTIYKYDEKGRIIEKTTYKTG